jgi:hypothetical protein
MNVCLYNLSSELILTVIAVHLNQMQVIFVSKIMLQVVINMVLIIIINICTDLHKSRPKGAVMTVYLCLTN